jgi:hypothetical protein
MALGHEKLDVYRLAIRYFAWVYEKAVALERATKVKSLRFDKVNHPPPSLWPAPITLPVM